ncbi:hypothetical protein BC629DRAFT_913079 [Irpex lacteus]|nr:hypothetical protein BC629DRAFT_913079 [Irpex lacteus]
MLRSTIFPALCIYEYLVTLDLEITRVWGIRRSRKVSVVTLLFIVNRYACLCYVGSDLVQLAAWGGVSSATANKVTATSPLESKISAKMSYTSGLHVLFTALRTYAIWDRNRKVFACVLVPGLVYPIGSIYINVVSTYRSRGTGTGCYEDIHFKFPADSDGPGGSRNRDYDVLYIVGRCVAILFECVALSLTWAKVIPVVRHLRRHNFSSTFILSRCFLYNGKSDSSAVLITIIVPSPL